MASPDPPLFTGVFPVNGATRLYGTIGDPIRQLRMTAIMPQVFAAVGVNALPRDASVEIEVIFEAAL